MVPVEPISLTVGAIGLASLFDACISCFNRVDRGRHLGEDYTILEIKFTNQEFRFVAWGAVCGFSSPDGYDPRLDEATLRARLEETLAGIKLLFEDGKTLKKRYGLKQDIAEQRLSKAGPSQPSLAEARWTSFKDRILRTQKDTSLLSTVKWVIAERDKFDVLIKHLNDLISDLERFTAHLNMMSRQRSMIQECMDSVLDISLLEQIEAARLNDEDAISDAASARLEDLCSPSSGLSIASVRESGSTYFTAPTHRSSQSTTFTNRSVTARARLAGSSSLASHTLADAANEITEMPWGDIELVGQESLERAPGRQSARDSILSTTGIASEILRIRIECWASIKGLQPSIALTSMFGESFGCWQSLVRQVGDSLTGGARSRHYKDSLKPGSDVYWRWSRVQQHSMSPYVGVVLHLRAIGDACPLGDESEASPVKYLFLIHHAKFLGQGYMCVGSDFRPTVEVYALITRIFLLRYQIGPDNPGAYAMARHEFRHGRGVRRIGVDFTRDDHGNMKPTTAYAGWTGYPTIMRLPILTTDLAAL